MSSFLDDFGQGSDDAVTELHVLGYVVRSKKSVTLWAGDLGRLSVFLPLFTATFSMFCQTCQCGLFPTTDARHSDFVRVLADKM
jgi:hypothetical protein